MASVYEDQLRLARDEALNQGEYHKLVRRSMWISVFLGIAVSTALLAYAATTKQIRNDELPHRGLEIRPGVQIELVLKNTAKT